MRLETQGDGMSDKLRVYKAGYAQIPQLRWHVSDHAGCIYRSFHSWDEAMTFATEPVLARLEHWLASQPRPWLGDDYWGKP